MMSVKFSQSRLTQLLLVLLLLASMISVISLAAQDEPAQTDKVIRKGFEVPRVFSFERFQARFHKHYKSLTELLARQKIFLANTFKAFISAVNYKMGRKSHYLKVNQMSDWTRNQLDRIYKKSVSKPVDNIQETPVASMEEIKSELANIIDNQKNSAEFKAIADELRTQTSGRKKRSLNVRSISASDLAGDTDDELMKHKSKNRKQQPRVQSNNPNYEPPEVTSFASLDEQTENEIEANGASVLASLPGIGYIKRLVNSMSKPAGQEPAVKSMKSFDKGRSKHKNKPEHHDEENTNDQDDESDKPIEPEVVIDVSEFDEQVYFDHRESGCFTEPKDQNECGSCYIFSTNALLEYAHCMETGQLVSFSEQYILDCGKDLADMPACEGGQETSVADFVAMFGMELSRNYPYVYKKGECPYVKTNVRAKQMGYMHVDNSRLINVKPKFVDEVLEDMPLIVAVQCPLDFSFYGGGVHNPKEACDPKRLHSMLAVGMGREDGLEYYLIRNSHSVFFGLEGYYKLAKESRQHCVKETDWFALEAIVYDKPFIKGENPRYKAEPIEGKHDQLLMATYKKKPIRKPLGSDVNRPKPTKKPGHLRDLNMNFQQLAFDQATRPGAIKKVTS